MVTIEANRWKIIGGGGSGVRRRRETGIVFRCRPTARSRRRRR